ARTCSKTSPKRCSALYVSLPAVRSSFCAKAKVVKPSTRATAVPLRRSLLIRMLALLVLFLLRDHERAGVDGCSAAAEFVINGGILLGIVGAPDGLARGQFRADD